ncbi:MAG: hypothetical protein IT372_33455 [Polyangiaceae bacterium]|nr:hypothetical protein [Polyangiaceae bacterium]
MQLRSRPVATATLLLSALAFAACAEPAPPPAAAPAAEAKKEPAPPPPPAEPEPAPSSSAEAGKAPDKPAAEQPKSGGGRIPVLKSDPEEVTDSFGSPPAKLEIGEGARATFRIPEDALSTGVNITFKIDKKGKSNGPPIGKIYRLTSVIPPAATPGKVETSGPPFELALPAGDRKDANLAIGELGTDDKGRPKITWTVVAPVKVDDATATAHFEIKWLSDAYLHITTKPPSAPAP